MQMEGRELEQRRDYCSLLRKVNDVGGQHLRLLKGREMTCGRVCAFGWMASFQGDVHGLVSEIL
jgi:hypothetical protein